MQSSRERENKKLTEEIQTLLSATTAKEKSLVEKFRSVGGAQVMEFCQFGTKEECAKGHTRERCRKLHFRKIINKHTDGENTDIPSSILANTAVTTYRGCSF